MATESSKKVAKKSGIFSCSICDYNTSRKSNYEKHLSTGKHTVQSAMTTLATHQATKQQPLSCEKCKKCYFNRTGLWRHKKKGCYFSSSDSVVVTEDLNANIIDKDTMLMFFKQNQEFQKSIFEFIKDNVGPTITQNTTTNNTNSNNTKFNLNFFLNETCKDAMNLSDFVNSLQITLTDLENVGKLGYTEGISRIFTKGLKELDVNKRPIHCSDLKRETVYVKNDNKWEKEGDQLKRAIKQITNKNIKLIPIWKEQNPGHQQYHNTRNDEYLKIMYESMGPSDEQEESKSFAKIITNLAKETVILR
jgi:hypothetical protein